MCIVKFFKRQGEWDIVWSVEEKFLVMRETLRG